MFNSNKDSRRRKTRCDANQPCSSCVLRNTTADCSSSARAPSRSTAIEENSKLVKHDRPRTFGNASSSFERPLQEIEKLRASIANLESDIQLLRQEYVSPQSRPTSDAESNWHLVMEVLPSTADCEVLIEFLAQECDWLFSTLHCPTLVDMWFRYRSKADVSDTTGAIICASIATGALILGNDKDSFYRLDRPGSLIHEDLIALAKRLTKQDCSSWVLEDIQLSTIVSMYAVLSGRHEDMLTCLPLQVQAGIRLGLFDENTEYWKDVSADQREKMRRLVWQVVPSTSWQALMSRHDLLESTYVNVCRPAYNIAELAGPVATPGTEHRKSRAFRFRASGESLRTKRLLQLTWNFKDILPRMCGLHQQFDKPVADVELLATECYILHKDILNLQLSHNDSEGFRDLDTTTLDLTDIVACKTVAQTLWMNHAFGHLQALLLRPWLAAGDVNVSAVHKRLHDACLANAENSMRLIPVVKALVASETCSFMCSFAISDFFGAATTFAIPVMRAVRYWMASSEDVEQDIRSLPLWPFHSPINNHPAVRAPIPNQIFADEHIRRSANNIIIILDALKSLRASPLGQSAEERLSQIVNTYGLSNINASDESWSMPKNGNGSVTISTTEPIQPALGPDYFSFLSAEDSGFLFDQLLQMDPSLWGGLLESSNGI